MDFTQNPVALGGLALAGVGLLFLVMLWRGRTSGPNDVNALGRVFLVLLRITIGWHFLVEGLDKLNTPNWSSEGYLREASGPLAPMFREIAGDSVIERLQSADNQSLPPALADDWQRYFDAFVAHYGLDAEQTKALQASFDQVKSDTVTWMNKPRSIKKPAPLPPDLYVDWTIADRLKEYESMQASLWEIEAAMPERGPSSWPEWRDAKAKAAKWRAELKSDLDGQTAGMKKTLTDSLSAEQKAKGPVPEPIARPIDWNDQLDASDNIVKYGLVGVGAALIAGCFTRLACVAGAVLLLMFFLAMPPLPYLPESPKSEGHYLYINKNIIEMFALLSLAFLPTGRWAGLDGILQFLNPFNYRSSRTVDPAVEQRLKK